MIRKHSPCQIDSIIKGVFYLLFLGSQSSTPRTAVIISLHLASLQQFSGINAVVAYGGDIVGEGAPTIKLILPILVNL